MNVSKNVYTSTTTNVTLTSTDLQEFIRNKFNISSAIPITIDFTNTMMNKEIGVTWMESTTSH